MKKGNVFFISIILLCFIIINIAAQFQLNEGYRIEELTKSGHWAVLGHGDHTMGTRIIPIVVSGILLLIIIFSLYFNDTKIEKGGRR